MPKKKVFDPKKEVRAMARERIGTVKPARAIESQDARKKVKHKKPTGAETEV
ncbi:MAG: hypothetical protein WKF37_17005 [Bryobacteraceae bacterium]